MSINLARSNRALKSYAGKTRARCKRATPNAGNAIGYCYAGKAGATIKSPVPNGGNAVGYVYAGKTGARSKSPLPNGGNIVRYGYAGKTGAVKSPPSNGGNAAWYGYAGKADAIAKSPFPNGGDAVGYGYAGKAVTLLKSKIINTGHGTTRKVKTDIFGIVANASKRISNTSISVVTTIKTAYIQLDCICGCSCIYRLTGQPCFKFSNAGKGYLWNWSCFFMC